MKNLLSATKIVLLALVFALISFVAFKIQIPDIFSQTLMLVVGYYFSQPKTNPPTNG